MLKKTNFYQILDEVVPGSSHESYINSQSERSINFERISISGLNEIIEVTTKPIVFDADNGGRLEHLPFMIKSLERIGVSAAIIEDKIGLKKNSLFKNQSGAQQDNIKKFCSNNRET